MLPNTHTNILTFDLRSNNEHLKSNQDIKRFRSRGNIIAATLLKPEKYNTDFVVLLDMVENEINSNIKKHKVTCFNGKSLLSHPSPPWTLSHLITFKSIWWIFFLYLYSSLSLFSYHMISFSMCFSKWLWERAAAASVSMVILSPIFLYSHVLQGIASVQEREMCKDEEIQRRHQLLCFTPVHSAGISYSKLLLAAFFFIKMSYTILYMVSFHSPSHARRL